MRAILVGSHFVPPAKVVLSTMKAGTEVELEAEPDNPYDENAIKVLVDVENLNVFSLQEKEEELSASGSSVEELMTMDRIPLGHIAASGGKPLQKALKVLPGLVGTNEVRGRVRGLVTFVGELIVVELGDQP